MNPLNVGAVVKWMLDQSGIAYSDVDYTVSGGAITSWDAPKLGPQPTMEQIEANELPWRRWQRKTNARADVETYIDGAIQPVTRSMLRDGEPVIDAATAEAVREFIADCYSAVNDFDDLVDLATLETINTVAVDLPAYEGPQQ